MQWIVTRLRTEVKSRQSCVAAAVGIAATCSYASVVQREGVKGMSYAVSHVLAPKFLKRFQWIFVLGCCVLSLGDSPASEFNNNNNNNNNNLILIIVYYYYYYYYYHHHHHHNLLYAGYLYSYS